MYKVSLIVTTKLAYWALFPNHYPILWKIFTVTPNFSLSSYISSIMDLKTKPLIAPTGPHYLLLGTNISRCCILVPSIKT